MAKHSRAYWRDTSANRIIVKRIKTEQTDFLFVPSFVAMHPKEAPVAGSVGGIFLEKYDMIFYNMNRK